jgi:hypothetical protein
MTVDVFFIRQALWRLRDTLLSMGTAPLGVLEGDREFAIMLAMKVARTFRGRPLHEKYEDFAGLDMPRVVLDGGDYEAALTRCLQDSAGNDDPWAVIRHDILCAMGILMDAAIMAVSTGSKTSKLGLELGMEELGEE